MIAPHGNRFASLDPENADLAGIKSTVPNAVVAVLDVLIEATKKLYDQSYPSNLFKNLTECKELSKEMNLRAPSLRARQASRNG